MMGGLKNPEQMAKAMNRKSKESTRDRLRRKLEPDPNFPKILIQIGNKYILKS